ncbi:MAG: restriction endonuclease [Candidatus Aenigmatarchaeota archaeon]
MVNTYLRGRIAEKKIVNDLREKGFENIRRSAGSRGPADVYACKDGRKYYIQVKSSAARITNEEVTKLRCLAQQRDGTAVAIHKDGNKKKWKFFGSW